MTVNDKIIALTGLPALIKEGTRALLFQLQGSIKIQEFDDLQSLNDFIKENNLALIIIDAALVAAGIKLLNNIRKENDRTSVVAIQYQYINQSLLNICDCIITIDQPATEIMKTYSALIEKDGSINQIIKSDFLSEREIEVLKLLVTGFSGKEIAEKLNISINTVITHRKNISFKTGIKSLAGLTIYAVTNKVISMNNLQ